MGQGICLGLILAGMNASFCHAFYMQVNQKKFLVALILAGIWFMMLAVRPFEKLEGEIRQKEHLRMVKHPLVWILLVLTFLAMAAHIVYNLPHYQEDWNILKDAVIHRYRRYYKFVNIGFSVSRYRTNGSRLLFMAELILAFVMAKAFAHKKGMFVGMLPPIAVVSAGLFLGKAPHMVDMLLLSVGSLGMMMLNIGRKTGGTKQFRQMDQRPVHRVRFYGGLAMMMALLFAASALLSVLTQSHLLQKEQEILLWQHNLERKAVRKATQTVQKVQRVLGKETPGTLTNMAPVYSGETVLTITTDTKPANDIYLRGFTGVNYQDGKWTQTEEDDLLKSFSEEDRYRLLCKDGFDFWKEYRSESGLGKKGQNMQIRYVKGNHSAYAYIPYNASVGSEQRKQLNLQGDLNFLRKEGVDSYQTQVQVNFQEIEKNILLQYYPLNQDDEERYATVKEVVIVDDREHEITDEFGMDDTRREYARYVIKADLQLPEKGLERTEWLVDQLQEQQWLEFDNGDSGYSAWDMIHFVKEYLADSTTYDRNLRARASGEDYLENFLFTQKKGFCEHYATAGTIIFRMMGIPARYVSGYHVSADAFKSNHNGTYTAEVLDSDAHAWSEIYLSGSGWTVADMTPGSGESQTNLLETEPSRHIGFHTPAPEITPRMPEEPEEQGQTLEEEKKKEEQTPTPAPTKESKKGNVEKKGEETKGFGVGNEEEAEGQTAGGKSLPLTIAGGVCMAALAAGAWYGQRRYRSRRLRHCNSNRQSILEMNRLMEKYLSCCGWHGVSRKLDREYLELLKKIYPAGCEDGQLEKYYQMIEAARFAESDRTEEEVVWCETLLMHLGRSAITQVGGLRRFYVRSIRNWR